MEKMGNMEERLRRTLESVSEVCIIGHDNIDVDSILSGILLSKLLKFLNINAKFMILEPIKKNDTYNIIHHLTDIHLYEYVEENEDELRTLFLVDHYETNHKGNVIGCIDHHPTKKENSYVFSYVRNCTATSYLIYELMKLSNYPLTAEEAKLIVLSMMVDTVAFRSSKAIPEEVKVAKSLAHEFSLDYSLLESESLCLTPIEKMSMDEITSNGEKKYNYNGHKVRSAYLQLDGMPEKTILNKWLDYIKNKMVHDTFKVEQMVFIIFDVKSNVTYEYQITLNSTKVIVHNGIISRGKDIMPQIEKKYD